MISPNVLCFISFKEGMILKKNELRKIHMFGQETGNENLTSGRYLHFPSREAAAI